MRAQAIPFGILAFLAVGVSLFSLHYFVTGARLAPPGIAENFTANTFAFLLHVGGGVIALGLGVWQFLPRTRRSSWHRLAGRVYVVACLLGGLGGFAIALGSTAGPVAQSGFAILAVLWIGATLKAYLTARARDFATHRIWMWRSFGLTCAAITLRLILPIGGIAGVPFEILYPITAWACWISSLGIAETLRWMRDRPRAALA